MIAALTKRMVELGASPEVIAVAVEAVTLVTLVTRDSHAPSRSVTRDKVKEQARVRQKRRRDKLAAQRKLVEAQANDGAAESMTVTRDASRDGVTERCNLSSFLPSLLEEGTTEKGRKRTENARARGTRMQAGAVLSDADRAAAIELGAAPDAVNGMWAEFVDYWTGIPGQRGTKVGERGWSGTWRNRVREITSRGRNRNAQATQRHPGGAYGASKDRFREAFAELKAYNRRSDEGDGEIVEFLPAAGRERA